MTIDTAFQQALLDFKEQRFDEAVGLLSRLLANEPNNAQARWLLVQALEGQNDTDEALQQIRILLPHVDKDLLAIDRIAGHMHRGPYPLDCVLDAYKSYLVDQPESATAAFNYAWYLAKAAQFEAAIRQYERALDLGIGTPEEVHLNIANIHMDHLHQRDEARAHLQKALILSPDYSSAFYNLGNLAEQEGNREEASDCFERCLQADPANDSALARLADTYRFAHDDDPLLARMVATAAGSTNSDLHFALGKAFEQLGAFSRAWEHFSEGNTLDQRLMPAYSPENTADRFHRIMTEGSPGLSGEDAGDSRAPVFICGMFRSGTTLLEQILAAHPGFVAGGESEFFPRLIAKEFPGYPQGARDASIAELHAWQQQHNEQVRQRSDGSARVTDKRPDNFLYIGLIKAILPSAKFIIMDRDWRDVATSVYSVRLGPRQGYATSLENIRHYIGLQAQLVDHWQTLLGSDLKRVRYEDLVQQPKETITELLAWLGESWDERCLSFHQLKNSVRTASVWQVREPLHGKSIGRWKNYEHHFAAVR